MFLYHKRVLSSVQCPQPVTNIVGIIGSPLSYMFCTLSTSCYEYVSNKREPPLVLYIVQNLLRGEHNDTWEVRHKIYVGASIIEFIVHIFKKTLWLVL